MAYVEREVRQLKETFDTTQQQHNNDLQQLHTTLHTKDTEATQLKHNIDEKQRQLDEKERTVRELQERVKAAEGRVGNVEAEMRYLLSEMASRQKLANQLAQTLTILP